MTTDVIRNTNQYRKAHPMKSYMWVFLAGAVIGPLNLIPLIPFV